ncbi:MAG: hypothetical protein K8S27_10930, partial [Candidatus Omnitrophica bacterium]|nr:hypothetical protein [Candidatus Omnitrophota bacterium]
AESVAIDIHGNQTISITDIDRATKTRTRTVDGPDSNIDTITVTLNGLLTTTQSKTDVVTTYGYDALERQTSVTDPRTGATVTYYDPVTGQLDYIQDPAGHQTNFTYDPLTGEKTTGTNAQGKVTRFDYNARGQVTHTWGSATYPVRYVYDSFGRLNEMHTWQSGTGWNDVIWPGAMEGLQDTTTWHYQSSTGLLTSKEDDAGNSVDYTYTSGGRLLTRAWARDSGTIVTTYGYDPNTAELIGITYSDGITPNVTFSYDRLGRQDTITDAVGTRTFGYNSALQLETETISGMINKIITRAYGTIDVIGRPNGFNTGSDYIVSYDFDATGRLNNVWSNVNGNIGTAVYGYLTNSDLLETLDTSSGQSTTYTYEPNRNVRTQVLNEFNSSTVSQYDYVYDSLGRRTSVQNVGAAFTGPAFNLFDYNDRGELAESARYSGTNINILTSPVTAEFRDFIYDPIGNRIMMTEGVNSGSYVTNNLNQYTTANVPAGGTNTFAHDEDGNLTSITGNKDLTYTYDAENRLIFVEKTNPIVGDHKLTLVYDYMGRRVLKAVLEYTFTGFYGTYKDTYYTYDGWNVVTEDITVGSILSSKYYVWGLDLSQSMQGAGGVGGLLAMVSGLNSYTYLYDGNGNVGQMLNSSTGAIEAHYEYDP